MKKQLQKKLSAFIVTAMMFSASANAQIVYTDIVPDSIFTITSLASQTYNLDINGDGTSDFSISAARVSFLGVLSSYVRMSPQGSNAIITTTFNQVKKLVLGDTISSSQAWQDTTGQVLKSYSQYGFDPPTTKGEWNTVVDGYVGLQLTNAGQTYYGWVRMDVTVSLSSASMTIKDYAFNSIPNQPILAGQTTTTGIIENSSASSINLFPNPATNHLTIDLLAAMEKVKVTITDITGKIIYSTIPTVTQRVEVNTKDFAEGIYVVLIQTAYFTGTKKLVVEK
ncbi:MAG: T9SS type A sorting domain-containing protein [Bacteroidia bacterium]